jgi:hypothetical protein
MLRHQAIAVALFLSAGTTGCEMAGAPQPEKPSTTPSTTAAETTPNPPPAPAPAPTLAPGMSTRVGSRTVPAELEVDRMPMTRGGPKWGKEKPRFKLVLPPSTPPATDSTPPDAAVPAPSK